jgi:hypothetical protein
LSEEEGIQVTETSTRKEEFLKKTYDWIQRKEEREINILK